METSYIADRREPMSVPSIMIFEEGFSRGIRCRFIDKCFTVDSYVRSKEGLLLEIERNMPDIIVLDLDIYAKIDGIKTSQKIRNRFNLPVIYKFTKLKINPITVWNWTL
jgi:CheY-like chemotaxis protein